MQLPNEMDVANDLTPLSMHAKEVDDSLLDLLVYSGEARFAIQFGSINMPHIFIGVTVLAHSILQGEGIAQNI